MVGRVVTVAIALIAIAFLGYVFGAFSLYREIPPATTIRDAYEAAKALEFREKRLADPLPSELWQPARTDARGVTIHDPSRAQAGLTLYSSGHDQKVLLVNMAGEVVHEWQLWFSKVWDETAVASIELPDTHMYVRRAQMFPNGDLLALYIGSGNTPWGYGLVKMDKDSNLIWKYLEQVHHDLDVTADGKIYTLTHAFTDHVFEFQRHLKVPRVDDFLVVLSPEGEELERHAIVDAFVHSPYARMTNMIPWYSQSDYFHTNAVDVIEAMEARALPFAKEGDVLLSFREMGAIALFDPKQETFTWALRGPWVGQHDPDILPNGRMLIFDNNGRYVDKNFSRVIEFDPEPLAIRWVYQGDDEHRFYSVLRSAEQRLENGNTLITESDGGRIFEVTRSGDIVWEYLNPVRAGENDELIPVVSWAQRIDPATLDPAFCPPETCQP